MHTSDDSTPRHDGAQNITLPTVQVLGLLLSNPTRDDWYAVHISRETTLGSSTVVQILYRLEQWGWVEARWEDAAEAFPQRRPRRRFYQPSH